MPHALHTLPPSEDLPEYRAMSAAGVVALLLSLLSLIALAEPFCWPVPLIALVVSVWAWRRVVRRGNEVSGRGVAWAGVLVSLAVSVSAPAQWVWHRHILAREASQVGMVWFDLLAHGETYAAWRLGLEPGRRPREALLPVDLANRNPAEYEQLQGFIDRPLVQKLLALGPKARACCPEILQQFTGYEHDAVDLVYQVHYEEDGHEQTLSVRMQLDRVAYRSRIKDVGLVGFAGWRIRLLES